METRRSLTVACAAWACCGLAGSALAQQASTANAAPAVDLPEPYATPSATHHANVTPWPEGATPTAPAGFQVDALARGIRSPRYLYVLPNGDVLVALASSERRSPSQIMLLRDADKNGAAEVQQTFIDGLNRPHGIVLVENTLFVANTDGLYSYEYRTGEVSISGAGRRIVELPAGGYNNHWTRNVIAAPDGSKLYVSVGSASNVGEHGVKEEERRAGILEVKADGSELRVFASGLRNPVGMDWEPQTGALWTVVNERDGLGDDLVPDYLTSVQDGGFYGWPYSYFGANVDPRWEGRIPAGMVEKAIVPEMSLGAHTASLGLAFYRSEAFPEKYRGGAFVGQRGSWNRAQFAGYRVAFVPFKDGKPAGEPEDFLTGFIKNADEVYGRPVGVAFSADGSLLVADEAGNTVWRVSVAANNP